MTTPIIDYQKISDAKNFYQAHGFSELAVPWILDYEAYAATRPVDRKEFYTLGGYLNASGEQSFIELMLSGVKLTRHMCITACWREEPVVDDIHYKYFMKLELIDTEVSHKNLQAITDLAKNFFDRYMPSGMLTKIIQTDSSGDTFDIIAGPKDIEVGSYGIRQYKKFKWIYATGLALPRFDAVLNKLNEPRH